MNRAEHKLYCLLKVHKAGWKIQDLRVAEAKAGRFNEPLFSEYQRSLDVMEQNVLTEPEYFRWQRWRVRRDLRRRLRELVRAAKQRYQDER